MNNTEYTPPKDIFEVDDKLEFNAPLEEDDPRYVDTSEARGEMSFHRIFKALKIDPKTNALRGKLEKSYNVIVGHRGCGKSTELRRLKKHLEENNLYYVVFIDTLEDLDINNLKYTDILLTLAGKLFEKLHSDKIEIDKVLLRNITEWFDTNIRSIESLKDTSMKTDVGVKLQPGIPNLFKFFTDFRASYKTGEIDKDIVRKEIVKTFTQFAEAFQLFLNGAADALKAKDICNNILFIIDGTDKLSTEDADNFFIKDVNQFQYIRANFLLTAPIQMEHLTTALSSLFGKYDIPMIKLYENREQKTKYEHGWEALRNLILNRADRSLFESDECIDELIQFSGGHPRDLLKLMHYAFLDASNNIFDMESIQSAKKMLRVDYQKILTSDDYELIVNTDLGVQAEDNSDDMLHLLRNTAILQYNNYWRASHPIVRDIPSYKTLYEKRKHKVSNGD